MNKIKQIVKTNRIITLVILVGSFSWILTMIKNGLPTLYDGVGFWGANGHDGIWHVALANSLARGSFSMPVFAGAQLQNYHIGFDLLLAVLYKVTTIPVSIWYFQIIPIVLSLSIGVLSYKFVKQYSKSKEAAIWSTFFIYFGGSFGYLVTLLRGEGLGGESMFWSQQSVSTLINPPFALSLIILLLALIYKDKKRWLTIILLGLLLSIKAYAGVLVLSALLVQSTFELLKDRSTKTLYTFIPSLVISLLLFIPLNRGAGQLVFIQPFWFLETMLSISDRFYWPKLYEAIINWRAAHIYYKALVGYAVAFIIFVIGNFGTRIFALMSVRKNNLNPVKLFSMNGSTVFLLALGFGGLLAPMLFLQTGTAWNTIQFFYYTLFVGAIFSGIGVNKFLSNIKNFSVKRIFIFLIIIFTIPTTISTLSQVYIPSRPPAKLSNGEIEALSFLKSQGPGIVLTYPYDPLLAKAAVSNPPRPLYLYESTAYVSAYSNHDVFLEDEVNLTIMNYQWKDRRAALDDFYKSTEQRKVFNFLRENNITYIYWVNPQFTKIGDLQLKLKNIFENKEVVIYKVMNDIN